MHKLLLIILEGGYLKEALLSRCYCIARWIEVHIFNRLGSLAKRPFMIWLCLLGIIGLITYAIHATIGVAQGLGLIIAFALGCVFGGSLVALGMLALFTQRIGNQQNPFVMKYECPACGDTFTEEQFPDGKCVCPRDWVRLQSKDQIEDRHSHNL